MIGYATIGTNQFDKAVAFYDQLLALMGGVRFLESDKMVAWVNDPSQPGLCVCKPYDGKPASVGNGVMIALMVGSNELVDQVYTKALALGATDEGAPGPREMPGFYAGYFRDLDGNKLNVFHLSQPAG